MILRRMILAFLFLSPTWAHAVPLKVVVLDFWDVKTRATDQRPALVKLMEEIRDAVSNDTRFSMLERDLADRILEEWFTRQSLGMEPQMTADLAGADRYLFASAESSRAGCYTVGSDVLKENDTRNGGAGWIDPAGNSGLYFVDQGLPANSVTGFAGHGGTLIAGTCDLAVDGGGLCVYDGKPDRWTGLGGFRVLSMYSDGDKLYVGTDRGIKVYGR